MDKKIIVKFNGGLGNQMFQYAFAYAISKHFQIDAFFDFSFFEDVKKVDSVTNREFELHSFNLQCKEASAEDFSLIQKNKKQSKFEKFFWNKLNIKAFKPSGNEYIQKNAYEFDKKVFEYPFYHYNGYFQNEEYFKKYRKDLIKLFTLKEEIDENNKKTLEQIINSNSISIHIRRGDYVALESAKKIHGVCSLKYYDKAIEHIIKNVENPHFFIFSDDIKWAVENIKIEAPTTIIDFNSNKGWLDLNLMKTCKHNIIANSSFSWWGAWLNENPDKIVVCPKKWTNVSKKSPLSLQKWIKY